MSVYVLLIGIAAGATAALLFASVAHGSALAAFLFYLSALPIMIAAVGFSHWAGLVAAIVAAAGLAVAFGGFLFVAFFAGVGLPAWWLGYLALLGRPAADGSDIEWYPAGHLVFWAALLGTMVVFGIVLSFGFDAETFRSELRSLFDTVIRGRRQIPANTPLDIPKLENPDRLLDFLVLALPPAAGVLTTFVNLVNLWLAGLIVRISGRLRRPWPLLRAIQFPAHAPAFLACAIAGSFVSGMPGIVAGVLTASLVAAYAVLGFAVLHTVTLGMKVRRIALAAAYILANLGWPLLLIALAGLIENVFSIRARFERQGPLPPSPHQT